MSPWRDKQEFKDRVLDWADKLSVTVRSMAVRPMKTKWASCSTSGRLTFDAALLGLRRELGEYVMVHELLHFSVPNHGKLWKALMRAHLGDYERLEKALRLVEEERRRQKLATPQQKRNPEEGM
jgi:predicted metal-dependent hydrolase